MTPNKDNMKNTDNLFCALVPAAGSGERMKNSVRKPYLKLKGKPILFHTLQRLRSIDECEKIVIAVHPGDIDDFKINYAKTISEKYGVDDVIGGGKTRQETVFNLLKYIPDSFSTVLIHDAARPLVRPELIEKVFTQVSDSGQSAIAAVPADETVKKVDKNKLITSTPPRSELWLAQTPQGFPLEIILRAHEKAAKNGWNVTDDASVVEMGGGNVSVVEGFYDNIKITTPEDLTTAEAILNYQTSNGIVSY